MKILDQNGNPIDRGVLKETQSSSISSLANTWLTPMLDGLTPAKLAGHLRAADAGDLTAQHRLFSDMEERDTHLASEMSKRKLALLNLDWDIAPPRNASAAEKAQAEWVKEILTDAADPIEDLILAMMDAVGHGFAPVELEWQQQGAEWLPCFHPRPQEWFRLSRDRRRLTLRDASPDGATLTPFGWVFHTHGKAKTGYQARMGLYRVLSWPFLYKAYAVGDFAEFLEVYGLPIIVGKYYSGASADEKASLLRAVTALGHDARAIMPLEMELEIKEVVGGGGSTPVHLAMVEWADRAQSKAILGGTLTSGADGKSSTNALGNVHNEVRHDLLEADARQLAATITRDLIYPLIALNKGAPDGLARCPRMIFDTGEPEDMALFADALPKLVQAGHNRIPISWVNEKLRIPEPDGDEPVLGAAPTPPASDKKPAAALAALTSGAGEAPIDPTADDTDLLMASSAGAWDELLADISAVVENAADLESLQQALVDAYGGLPTEQLRRLMAAAFALADIKGLASVVAEENRA